MGVGAAAVILVLVTGIGFLRAHREAASLRLQLNAMTSERDGAVHERDAQAQAIKPFEALAEQQFANRPSEQRLPLLYQRVETITEAISHLHARRQLDPEAIKRIREKLNLAPGLDIEVGGIAQDPEAMALAQELKSVFDAAGLKTRKLAQYIPSSDIPAGVSVYSRHVLDQVLSEAIGQIFTELDQKRAQWLEENVASSNAATEGQPELKIIVGSR